MPTDRIYPVPIKPPSKISGWNDWPDDVRDTLRAWNSRGGEHRLTFAWGGIFKCWVCERFCQSHTHGAAQLDGDKYCDDCIIEKARGWVVLSPLPTEGGEDAPA